MQLTRRSFLGVLAASGISAAEERYKVGITTNTRGGWESDVFLSFREAKEVGYKRVESFIHYFVPYMEKPDALKAKMAEIGVEFVTISNGGPLDMNFEDPAKRQKILEEHLGLVRFIKKFGCTHLKINTGGRKPNGTPDEDLKQMSITLNELGKRITAEGLQLAVHPHMWTQLENRREIDFVMGATDPQHVKMVVDTGHITMAGIDPVELTRAYGNRIREFHLKDTDRAHRGGAKQRRDRNDPMKDPIFFELGKGGVDFVSIKEHLDKIQWRGNLTVELDSSPSRPPKESARISRSYIEQKLGIKA